MIDTELVTSAKYLGLYVRNDLPWRHQSVETIERAN